METLDNGESENRNSRSVSGCGSESPANNNLQQALYNSVNSNSPLAPHHHHHHNPFSNNIMATADVFFSEVANTSRVARYYTSGSMHSYSQSESHFASTKYSSFFKIVFQNR